MRINSNYHTHTTRCKHASGTDREYVEAAISAGIKTLGFSDHVPYPFDGDYTSRIRMGTDETENYFSSLLKLKEEYRDSIEIHIGFEAEYYPKLFNNLLSLLADYPCEYLILGQHQVFDERGEAYLGIPFDDKKILQQHTDMTVEAIETGKFLYVAHPDIANFVGDESFYLSQARRICRAAKIAGMPLEINMLGMRELRWYPRGSFFEAAAEEGNKLIIGVDAHSPEHFTGASTAEAENDCMEFAESFGLEIVGKIL